MRRRSAHLAHILNVLKQVELSKQSEIARAKSRIADMQSQRSDVERLVTNATPVIELVIGSAAARLARLGNEIAVTQKVLSTLTQSAVETGRKRKLVEKRLEAALAEESADAGRRELEELASWLQSASLRQGR